MDSGLPRRSMMRSTSAIRRHPVNDVSDRQARLGEVVDHSQGTDPPPGREFIGREFQRLASVYVLQQRKRDFDTDGTTLDKVVPRKAHFRSSYLGR